jgi:hypothetical protein
MPIPLEGNSTQSEGVTESNQEKDGSSSSHTEEDNEETPGFGTIFTITALLMVTGLLGKRCT